MCFCYANILSVFSQIYLKGLNRLRILYLKFQKQRLYKYSIFWQCNLHGQGPAFHLWYADQCKERTLHKLWIFSWNVFATIAADFANCQLNKILLLGHWLPYDIIDNSNFPKAHKYRNTSFQFDIFPNHFKSAKTYEIKLISRDQNYSWTMKGAK